MDKVPREGSEMARTKFTLAELLAQTDPAAAYGLHKLAERGHA
jgi:hypothetical protein